MLPLSSFVLVAFAVIVFNQSVQVIQLAWGVHSVFGKAVLCALVIIYSALILIPVYLWVRLPKPMQPPANTDCPEYATFLAGMRKRLSRNSRLAGQELSTGTHIEAALRTLNRQADSIVSDAASTVFLSTAVSQSGRLDGLVVLVAQCRLVWQVAHIYQQRPSPRQFVHLYANVATTAFVAGEIEDIDLEGLLATILGSGVAAFPGVQLLANSVVSGAANAFLTLRVGMIAKQYCNCLVRIDKRSVRRAATVQAAKLLGRIVRDGVARISKAAVSIPKELLKGLADRIVTRFEKAAATGD
jgi:uncharacterized membrane protein YcjF (UPF0283 family)